MLPADCDVFNIYEMPYQVVLVQCLMHRLTEVVMFCRRTCLTLRCVQPFIMHKINNVISGYQQRVSMVIT